MPESTPLSIQDAKNLAVANNQDIVIVIGVGAPGRLCVCSWGRNKQLCDIAGVICKGLFSAVRTYFAQLATEAVIDTAKEKGRAGRG